MVIFYALAAIFVFHAQSHVRSREKTPPGPAVCVLRSRGSGAHLPSSVPARFRALLLGGAFFQIFLRLSFLQPEILLHIGQDPVGRDAVCQVA